MSSFFRIKSLKVGKFESIIQFRLTDIIYEKSEKPTYNF